MLTTLQSTPILHILMLYTQLEQTYTANAGAHDHGHGLLANPIK